MCSCDFEPAKVYRSTRRTARKAHPCEECQTPIVPGEVHLDCAALWDGAWSSFKVCLFCDALRSVAHGMPQRSFVPGPYVEPTVDEEIAEAMCCAAIGEAEEALREVDYSEDGRATIARMFGRAA